MAPSQHACLLLVSIYAFRRSYQFNLTLNSIHPQLNGLLSFNFYPHPSITSSLSFSLSIHSGGTRGGGMGGQMPPQLEALPPTCPPSQNGIFFFFLFFSFFLLFFFFFLLMYFFTYVLSGRYRPLLQKVAKCKKYNKFKDFAFNTLAFQKVTNMTFKYSNFRALKSVNPKSSGGSAPWTPGRGSAPAPRQGP